MQADVEKLKRLVREDAALVNATTRATHWYELKPPVHGRYIRLPKGSTPLVIASICGYEEMVPWLLAHGADIETRDCYSCDALFHASRNGHLRIVCLLIEHGAYVRASRDCKGRTALMMACDSEKPALVAYLLENGSLDTINEEADDSTTALHFSCLCDNLSVVQVLLAAGADPNVTDKDGKTPLGYAARRGDLQAIALLEVCI